MLEKGDAWSRLRWSTASLRAHVLAVTLLATVPMTMLATWLVSQQALEGQAQMKADLARAARAFALTVDRELASSAEALQVLALSELLQEGDLAGVFSSMTALRSPRQSWSSVKPAAWYSSQVFRKECGGMDALRKVSGQAYKLAGASRP